jgi:PRTRC genetic system protein B
MRVGVEIGETKKYQLKEALLVYEGSNNECFVSRHAVSQTNAGGGTPILLPAQPLTKAFLESLVLSLGGSSEDEVLPPNILAKGHRMIAWWTPACHRQLFFSSRDPEIKKLNGRIYPHPPLVWLVRNWDLSVRALIDNGRPGRDTALAVAPYWNISDKGLVCLGDAKTPTTTRVDSLEGWEKSFFQSKFTHSNVGRATRHEGGFAGLWKELAEKEYPFPKDALIPLPQTLESFIEGKPA